MMKRLTFITLLILLDPFPSFALEPTLDGFNAKMTKDYCAKIPSDFIVSIIISNNDPIKVMLNKTKSYLSVDIGLMYSDNINLDFSNGTSNFLAYDSGHGENMQLIKESFGPNASFEQTSYRIKKIQKRMWKNWDDNISIRDENIMRCVSSVLDLFSNQSY